MKRIDLTGQQFTRWKALEYVGNRKYKCQCECGIVVVVQTSSLTSGKSRGCFQCSVGRRLPEGEGAFNTLYSSYKANARSRQKEWGLSKAEARELFLGTCAYCGVLPSAVYPSGRRHGTMNGVFIYNGIDRVDNAQGYLLCNCVSCCKMCNFIKQNLPLEVLREHIFRMAYYMKAEKK